MRKVMLLAAMLAMMLVAAAPAFAQVTQNAAQNISGLTAGQCQQVLNQANQNASGVQYNNATQVQYCAQAIGGDNNVTGGGGGQAVIAPGTVVQGVNLTDTNGNGVVTAVEAQNQGVTANAFANAAASAEATAAAGATAATTVLPDTGGASLFALGAGTLLVAGGLLARRIVR